MNKTTAEWNKTKKDFYGTDYQVSVKNGIIDFSTNGMHDIKNGENLTYDEYLDIQYASLGQSKDSLEEIYFNNDVGAYRGEISKKTHGNILFRKLFVDATRPDGTCYEAKESHVWMDDKPFEQFELHTCVEFYADVYRYLKTGHGKQIDYGLCNPTYIKQIPQYQLPTDEQIEDQIIDDILWETSKYHDVIDRINWSDVRNEEEYQQKFKALKSLMGKKHN